MTKEELIEALKDFPDHWEVFVSTDDGDTNKIVEVEQMQSSNYGGSRILLVGDMF